ncbi:MAG: heptaprenyl diphosphate synthase component 2 [Bacillota bacterium]|nr:heptaprenyl diphosphate synthase component 2 [Bacillota bacterium]
MTAPVAAEGTTALADTAGTSSGVAADLKQVEEMLERLLAPGGGRRAPELGRGLALAGGKRLRPRLFLLAFRSLSPAAPTLPVYRLAAALELLHLATLAHDDVIDGATVRRGHPSLNAAQGERAAVLVGDFFFSQFLTAAAPSGPRALNLMAGAITAMVEGELEQAEHRFDVNLSEEGYYSIIGKKTAGFLAAACELGALAARAGRAAHSIYRRFGLYLGYAFQIQDDILDYVGDPHRLGKPRGSDLAQGVITLPLIQALKTGRQAPRLRALLTTPPLEPGDAAAIRAAVESCGGIAYARARADEFCEHALAELAKLPPSPTRMELEGLVQALRGRQC